MNNKQYIDKYADKYVKKINEMNGTISWWNFTKWLASFTFAGNFTNTDIEYAKKAIGYTQNY